MTYTTQGAAVSSIPFRGSCNGPDYSPSEHIGFTVPVTLKPLTAIIHDLNENVTHHADSFSKSWYNQEFPGVFLHGVRKMHWRLSFLGNDAELSDTAMRSSS